jgi:hypothetical protein
MSTISAGTTSNTALVSTGDTTGALVLQTNGTTTAMTISTAQIVSLTSSLALLGSSSGSVRMTAPAVAGTQSYTLPTAQPTANGQALVATTAGVMSWATPVASAGSTTQVIYNSSGTLTGSANLTFSGTDLTVGGILNVGSAVGGSLSVSGSVASNFVGRIYNSNADPKGVLFYYSAAAPNNAGTANSFATGQDTSAMRWYFSGNGGLNNFSANNTNLSDIREKKNISLAGNYLDKINAIPVKTFLYNDQTDNDLNLGVIAQDVQAVAPELVMESDWGINEEPKMRLSVYQTDLQYALMKSIQELSEKLDVANARIAALEAK